jgi:NAD(P)-dependent dehydrogenase (short-subunit alcohol dehydrogenase family)
VAKAAAAAGAHVVVNDIDQVAAEAVAGEIHRSGGRAIAFVADICTWSQAEQLIDHCVAEYGRIDGLVNNAGVFRMAPIADAREEDFRRLFEVNVFGLVACTVPAARRMAAQGSGSIVNMTSGAQKGLPGMGAYGATKGAVASLTYTWALELGRSGVRCNAVSPVAMTRMVDTMRDFLAAKGLPFPDFSQMPSAASIAPVIAYLLSDAAREVNGQIVRLESNRLGFVTHPAVLLPLLERPEWDISLIGEAFELDLLHRQVPVGSHAIKAEFVTSGYLSEAATRMLGS